MAAKESILKRKEQVQDYISKIDKCGNILPLLARSIPITKQKLAPNEKVKYCKGSKCNYKDVIVKGTIHTCNCKNNRGRDRACKARIKKHILKNNIIEEISAHSLKYYCSTSKTGVIVDTKQEIIELTDKISTKHVA